MAPESVQSRPNSCDSGFLKSALGQEEQELLEKTEV